MGLLHIASRSVYSVFSKIDFENVCFVARRIRQVKIEVKQRENRGGPQLIWLSVDICDVQHILSLLGSLDAWILIIPIYLDARSSVSHDHHVEERKLSKVSNQLSAAVIFTSVYSSFYFASLSTFATRGALGRIPNQ